MISLPLDSYQGDSQIRPSSPRSVADVSVTIEGSEAANSNFIRAPKLFFGKYLAMNVQKRGQDEVEANQNVRVEFHGNLHAFFGPVLAEYLYPQEQHEEFLQKGSPLTLQHAQQIVHKGIEMMEALAESCMKCLGDEAKKLSQPDLFDQAMIRYADEQETLLAKQGGIIDLLPDAAKAVAGGTMAAFAVATMGHLTPADIFFLVDFLNDKKLSKGIEDFITTRLVQHINYYLEEYLQERRNSKQPFTLEEEKSLRELLTSNTQLLSRDYVAPSTRSAGIRAANLSMEGSTHFNDALNYIFLSPLESVNAGSAHSRIFRDGVTALIENIKKIEDSISKTRASAEELSRIQKAIQVAGKRAELVREKTTQAPTNSKNQERVGAGNQGASIKANPLPPPWRRGM